MIIFTDSKSTTFCQIILQPYSARGSSDAGYAGVTVATCLFSDTAEKPALSARCRVSVDQCEDRNADCVSRQCQCSANFTSDNTQHCRTSLQMRRFITARCYASALLAMALCLSVCPSVCPSVTSRSSTKTAKRRITQTTPHDSSGTLVF